jgi:hypothetical protein
MDTYDAVLDIEDLLIDSLDDGSDVDGHDVGSDEMNIFVSTDDPQATFKRVEATLPTHPLCVDLKAAFRAKDQDYYSVLWPESLRDFSVA